MLQKPVTEQLFPCWHAVRRVEPKMATEPEKMTKRVSARNAQVVCAQNSLGTIWAKPILQVTVSRNWHLNFVVVLTFDGRMRGGRPVFCLFRGGEVRGEKMFISARGKSFLSLE